MKQPDKSFREQVAESLNGYWKGDLSERLSYADKILALLPQATEEVKELTSNLAEAHDLNTAQAKKIAELEGENESLRSQNMDGIKRVKELEEKNKPGLLQQKYVIRVKELETELEACREANTQKKKSIQELEKHVAELKARMIVPEIAEIVSKKLDSPLKVVDQDNNDTYTNGNSYRFLVSESIAGAIVKHLKGA